MEREEVVQRVRSSGLIAIFRHTDASLANDTASALLEAGIDVVEVTLNTRGALDMLGSMRRAFGDRLVVGAGTVMSAEAADEAIAAGARLIVCPHLDEAIVRRAVERKVAVVPGGFTPTEIVRAWNAGASFVKVFPAGPVGPRYIRDVLAPLNQIPLVPTGGVSLNNAAEFIRAGASALGLGNALVDPKVVAERRFADLTLTARAFVAAVRTGRGKAS
ncbi:MAG TPA: bifunctional 4-hydroxy-2-oxoglutarate aldolase/2-dehydro-3-deoxy-phosphogluconate aldolase [Chloroflexota bacterium]|nr:bifunctional 4-hydroxy-2-oxoglutarate aldolase/2-dehydro-3-deoxy-phosphogluconate aldolase [Chloroflexota bacterium]